VKKDSFNLWDYPFFYIYNMKIKLAAIYKIEHNSGYYYVGYSTDYFSRMQGHYTQLIMNKHSSKKFQELWNNSEPSEWSFSILEYVSITEYKKEHQIKGKQLEKEFRTLLLKKEKEWMNKFSINWCLNQNDKHFG
jgi:predicted GIY-YIG superfamily endonuclease